jgi:hypothetical protein
VKSYDEKAEAVLASGGQLEFNRGSHVEKSLHHNVNALGSRFSAALVVCG